MLDHICDLAAGRGAADELLHLLTWLECDRPSPGKWEALIARASTLEVRHAAVEGYLVKRRQLAAAARLEVKRAARDRFVEAWSSTGPVDRLVAAAAQGELPVSWLPDE